MRRLQPGVLALLAAVLVVCLGGGGGQVRVGKGRGTEGERKTHARMRSGPQPMSHPIGA